MITNYYTLQALVQAWRADLTGCLVDDVFSQDRDALTLAFSDATRAQMLRLSVRAPFHYIFSQEGYNKARKNVATLFEAASGRAVTDLRLAERDRVLFLALEGGMSFQMMLFGPRANVFLLDPDRIILEAFQDDATWSGKAAPLPRPAPEVRTSSDFEARWRTNRKTTVQAIAAALPLFDRALAAEVYHRAGITATDPAACSEADRQQCFETAQALRAELANPNPKIYWQGRFVEAFSLVPLQHLTAYDEEAFASVGTAVSVFVRRTLGQQQFRNRYSPLEKALVAAQDHSQGRAERMLEELSQPSRADRYEHWGHLLMASAASVPKGNDEVVLPDLFGASEAVSIPLDPRYSAVENAERYYDKARRTRQARLHAEERMLEMEEKASEAGALLDALRGVTTLKELDRFQKSEADRLTPYYGKEAPGVDRIPFRRFVLSEGYEVWVGKQARQNDLLTLRYAKKYDLWMHARGVGGSHVVLRLPNREAKPPPKVLEQAAGIAAYYSKARGSSLVPVIVVPRKYVRKPKGAPPGAVVVEREEVLLVIPRLPV